MVGLLDYDCLHSISTSKIIPNLEIMKLATYYQKEENHFCRLLTLDEKELDCYEKIYFFSETGKKLIIPDEFKRASNVIYGGTAFTNKKYIPFENSIIDYTLPKIFIYKNFLKEKYDSGIKNNVISHTLDDTYYRMYAGKNKLPVPAIQMKKKVYIFDRNLFCEGWEDIIDYISDKKPSCIYTIHPIVCNTLTQFFEVRAKNKIAKSNETILDLNIPLEDVNYMLKKYAKLFLAEINEYSTVFLPLKSEWITTKSYYKNLIYTLNLLYAFWARKIPIKIYVEYPALGIKNPILDLETCIAYWSCRTHHKNPITILERIKKEKVALEQYNKIIQEYPSAKTLFDQTREKLFQGGLWRL